MKKLLYLLVLCPFLSFAQDTDHEYLPESSLYQVGRNFKDPVSDNSPMLLHPSVNPLHPLWEPKNESNKLGYQTLMEYYKVVIPDSQQYKQTWTYDSLGRITNEDRFDFDRNTQQFVKVSSRATWDYSSGKLSRVQASDSAYITVWLISYDPQDKWIKHVKNFYDKKSQRWFMRNIVDSFLYDSLGRLMERHMREAWDQSTVLYDQSDIYEYRGATKEIIQYRMIDNTRGNEGRRKYTYTNGFPTVIDQEDLRNGRYQPRLRIAIERWPSGQIKKREEAQWNDGDKVWELYYRSVFRNNSTVVGKRIKHPITFGVLNVTWYYYDRGYSAYIGITHYSRDYWRQNPTWSFAERDSFVYRPRQFIGIEKRVNSLDVNISNSLEGLSVQFKEQDQYLLQLIDLNGRLLEQKLSSGDDVILSKTGSDQVCVLFITDSKGRIFRQKVFF